MFSNFQSSLVGSLKDASSKISEISGKASQSLQKDLAGFQGVGVSLPPGIAGGSSQESPARGPRGPRESSETPGTRKGTPAKGSGRQKSASSVAGGSGGGVEYVRLSTEAARRLQIMEKGDVRTLARLHAAETQNMKAERDAYRRLLLGCLGDDEELLKESLAEELAPESASSSSSEETKTVTTSTIDAATAAVEGVAAVLNLSLEAKAEELSVKLAEAEAEANAARAEAAQLAKAAAKLEAAGAANADLANLKAKSAPKFGIGDDEDDAGDATTTTTTAAAAATPKQATNLQNTKLVASLLAKVEAAISKSSTVVGTVEAQNARVESAAENLLRSALATGEHVGKTGAAIARAQERNAAAQAEAIASLSSHLMAFKRCARQAESHIEEEVATREMLAGHDTASYKELYDNLASVTVKEFTCRTQELQERLNAAEMQRDGYASELDEVRAQLEGARAQAAAMMHMQRSSSSTPVHMTPIMDVSGGMMSPMSVARVRIAESEEREALTSEHLEFEHGKAAALRSELEGVNRTLAERDMELDKAHADLDELNTLLAESNAKAAHFHETKKSLEEEVLELKRQARAAAASGAASESQLLKEAEVLCQEAEDRAMRAEKHAEALMETVSAAQDAANRAERTREKAESNAGTAQKTAKREVAELKKAMAEERKEFATREAELRRSAEEANRSAANAAREERRKADAAAAAASRAHGEAASALGAEKTELEAQVRRIEAQLVRLESENESLKERASSESLRASQEGSKLADSLKQRLEEVTRHYEARLEERDADARAANANLETQLARLTEDNDRLRAESGSMDDIASQRESLELELAEYQQRLDHATREVEALRRYRDEARDAERRRAEMEDAVASAASDAAAAQRRSVSASAELENLRAELVDWKRKHANAREESELEYRQRDSDPNLRFDLWPAAAKASIARHETMEEGLRAELEGLREEIRLVEKRREVETAEVTRLSTLAAQAESSALDRLEMVQALQSEIEGLREAHDAAAAERDASEAAAAAATRSAAAAQVSAPEVGSVDTIYLRKVMMEYMKAPKMRPRLLPAVATLLSVPQSEFKALHEAAQKDANLAESEEAPAQLLGMTLRLFNKQ